MAGLNLDAAKTEKCSKFIFPYTHYLKQAAERKLDVFFDGHFRARRSRKAMVDVASIIVAVIALVGGVVAAGITAWFAYFSDERKRLSEAEKLIAKYRDPLLLAAQDLQSRLYNITDHGVTNYFRRGGGEKENLLLYTAFLVGQFFAWVHILRLQAQFLRFATDDKNKRLTKVLGAISFEFSTDEYDWDGMPWNLWRGQQMAIGELMTVGDAELLCMGYAAFNQKWKEDGGMYGVAGGMGQITGTSLPVPEGAEPNVKDNDQVATAGEVKEGDEDGKDDWSGEFRPWFRPIIEGVTKIAIARTERHQKVPDQRLRRLQHLVLDLIHLLDEKGLRSEAIYTSYCHRAVICKCAICHGKTACPCDRCKGRPTPGHV